jgi:uncharacterized protein (DUF2147 family)
MKSMFRFAITASLLFGASSVFAANDTPVGTWKTIDDDTHQAKSIVVITDDNGELHARIVKLINRTPDDVARDGEHALCAQCEGDLKNKPVEGLTIMWGVRKDGDIWDGGKIVNPKDGKVYKVKLSMLDGGQKLNVRGYIGFSWVGKTQVWERQE